MDYFDKLCKMINSSIFLELRYSYDEWNDKQWDFRIDCHPMIASITSINTTLEEAITNCYNKIIPELLITQKNKIDIGNKKEFESLIKSLTKNIDKDIILALTYGEYKKKLWMFKSSLYSFDRIL